MPEQEHILKCRDCEGKLVIFHRHNYDIHKKKHPELEDTAFFPDRVRNALKYPTFTIPGNGNSVTCYYVEEFSINGIIKYTKVVLMNKPYIMANEKIHHIMTAHKVGHVQEEKYPGLKKQMYHKGNKI